MTPFGIGPGLIVAAAASGPPAGASLDLDARFGVTTGATFTWADQSGSGHGDLTQTTSGQQPTTGGTINSKPALNFSAAGSGQNLSNASAVNTWLGAGPAYAFSMAAVFQYTGTQTHGSSTWPSPLLIGGAGTGGALGDASPALLVSQNGSTHLNIAAHIYDTNDRYTAADGTYLKANPHYIVATWDSSSNLLLYVDGNAAVSNTFGSLIALFNNLSVGGDGISGNDSFNGQISKLMIYPFALSPTQVTALNTYLKNTWGF